MNGQKFEIHIRTVINGKGEAVSSMKVDGLASAEMIVRAMDNVITGIKQQAAIKAAKPVGEMEVVN